MIFTNHEVNPLPALFELIGESGVVLTRSTITSIAKVLNTGGVIAQTEKELLVLLNLFIEWYGLLEIVEVDNIHYLRKINGSETT